MFPRARPLVGFASTGVGGAAWKGRAPLGFVTDVRVCAPRRPARRAWACRHQPEKEAGLVSLSEDGGAGLLHEVQAEAAVREVRVLVGRALERVRVDAQHERLGET